MPWDFFIHFLIKQLKCFGIRRTFFELLHQWISDSVRLVCRTDSLSLKRIKDSWVEREAELFLFTAVTVAWRYADPLWPFPSAFLIDSSRFGHIPVEPSFSWTPPSQQHSAGSSSREGEKTPNSRSSSTDPHLTSREESSSIYIIYSVTSLSRIEQICVVDTFCLFNMC